MGNREIFEFRADMNEKTLWYFSMYHANKGYLGIFNVLFTLAALYLLVTTWADSDAPYRIMLVICALLFTVYQPLKLRLKAKKQASLAVMKEPIFMVFTRDGFTVRQGEQDQEIAWNQVGRVEGTKGMVMIYMDRIHAFLLPNEAMGEKRGEFCAMLKEVLPKERRKRI